MNARLILVALCATASLAGGALALTAAQTQVGRHFAAAAPGDVARGAAFFFAPHVNGKGETKSCTSCHTTNLKAPGKSAAGKEIGPMAASVAPSRLADVAEVEKWLRRNCNDVLGRECSAQEKSDVVAFLLSL